jgi:hypothetical protein
MLFGAGSPLVKLRTALTWLSRVISEHQDREPKDAQRADNAVTTLLLLVSTLRRRIRMMW